MTSAADGGGGIPPGACVLPEGRREGGLLVYREPLRDTLVPLFAVGALDLAACLGIVLGGTVVRTACFLVAATASFLVFALAASLLRPRLVRFDAARGRVELRRAGDDVRAIPLEEVAGVEAVAVTAADGAGRPLAAVLRLRDGRRLPLHVGWETPAGGGPERARAVAAEVARYLGLPEGAGAGGAS